MPSPDFSDIIPPKFRLAYEDIIAALKVKLYDKSSNKWKKRYGAEGNHIREYLKGVLTRLRILGLKTDEDALAYFEWLVEASADKERPYQADTDEEIPTETEEEAVEEAELDGDLLFEENYVYNKDTDTYLTFLKNTTRPLSISGEKHRAMKREYSNWDGQPATINQICRRFGLPRPYFDEYRRLHGWTHDSEPFTNEELLERDEDDMVEEALQLRRQSIYEKFEKRKWKETKEDAEKWRHFEQYLLAPLEDLAEAQRSKLNIPKLMIRRSRSPFAVVMGAVDIHLGQKTQNYDRAKTRDILHQNIAVVLEDILEHGQPEQIIWPAGNDFFHIDTDDGTTTKGTPKGTELDGTPPEILHDGFGLGAELAGMLLQATKQLLIKFTPGNHDRLLGQALVEYLKALFKDDNRVVVDTSYDEYKYGLYGKTMYAFTHKPKKDMGARMASKQPKMWGESEFRVVFYGHQHHEEFKDDKGVTSYKMPSITATDRWHERSEFDLARRALGAYRIDKERGVIGHTIAPVLG